MLLAIAPQGAIGAFPIARYGSHSLLGSCGGKTQSEDTDDQYILIYTDLILFHTLHCMSTDFILTFRDVRSPFSWLSSLDFT